MIIAISGTPGTGKTSISSLLSKSGFNVFDLNKIAINNNLIDGFDEKRNSKILDLSKIDDFVKNNLLCEDIVFIEGHSSHLLKNVDKVIILRCHPKELEKRLKLKGWKIDKIKENIEAEALDVILSESYELFCEKDIFEIDTTKKNIDQIYGFIKEIYKNKFEPIKKYKIGSIDWSEEYLS